MPAEDNYEDEAAAVLAAHERYLAANTTIDSAQLATLWDDNPSNVFFNLSGHNYRGLKHWLKLWDYYTTRFEMKFPWISWDHNIWVSGDVAWMTCLRMSQLRWIGEGEGPIDNPIPSVSRSTEIYRKVDGEWKTVHVHYSPASMSPRPGNV